MDSSQPREPTRLSALYQYHNAPEVAPAHGLEYDDAIYASSDKYPVIRESPLYQGKFNSTGARYNFGGENRNPRIIFGMKIRTFLLVASAMILITVGAAVGGAVGGRQLRESHDQATALASNANTSIPSSASNDPSSTTPFSAAIPTYTPLSDCPPSNNTTYTSRYATGATSNVATSAGLTFTKHCDLTNPLLATNVQRIAEAFVYSFSDCVEVCAALNFWSDGTNCTVAVYQAKGSRPGNCWVGNAGEVRADALSEALGTNVAILQL